FERGVIVRGDVRMRRHRAHVPAGREPARPTITAMTETMSATVSATRDAADLLLGRWVASSTIAGEPTPYPTTFVFNDDHTVKAEGPENEDGVAAFLGSGHWIAAAGGGFLLHLTHPL